MANPRPPVPQSTEGPPAVVPPGATPNPVSTPQPDSQALREEPTLPPAASGPPADPNASAVLAGHPRYRVLQLLGVGGMGAVYKAEHLLMRRTVALKVINPSLTANAAAVDRFVREVIAAARLAHPNIVTAYDAEQWSGTHFLVMEFVDGTSLADVIKKGGPLSVVRACNYIAQAAQGLQHAFERGMVHRDIKPQNLMLTAKGQVKILDFGLARFVSESNSLSGISQEGSLMGTPDYMAPEQARDSHAADIRADIYSLGCTLYFLLTRQCPFPKGTVIQKAMAHIEQMPQPVTGFRQDLPPALVQILERMMAKDPAQRYQIPVEVVRALAPFSAKGKVRTAEGTEILDKQRQAAAPPEAPPRDRSLSENPRPSQRESAGPADVFADLIPAPVRSAGPQRTVPKPAARKRRSPAEKPAAKKKWMIGVGVATGLLLLGLVGLWASGVFVKTKNGTIELKNLPPDAEVRVDGEQAKVTWGSGKSAEITVKPGTHQIVAKVNGIEVIGQEITIKEGGREVLIATVVPTRPKEITNSLGMKLVLIPPGKFQMGSPESDKDASPDEKPQHEVEITKAFYLGAHTVTVGQFQCFVRDEGYQTEAEKDGRGGGGYNEETHDFEGRRPQYTWKYSGWQQTSEHPVVNVSWNDAVAFCDWLSRKEGQKYRLPTEAEWEYCCRAGTTTRFYSGDEGSSLKDIANIADTSFVHKYPKAKWGVSWDDGFPFTAPVGRFKPNLFGLYDMHGNVWQWCEDWYGDDYYKKNAPRQDPPGPSAGTSRVRRGGSFYVWPAAWRAACRFWNPPSYCGHDIGFRVVLAAPGKGSVPVVEKFEPVRWVADGHKARVTQVKFSRDGSQVFSTSDDSTLRIWNVESGKEVQSFSTAPRRIWSLSISAKSRLALAGLSDGTVQPWDVDTGQPKTRWTGHSRGVPDVTISPDDQLAASAGDDGIVLIRELQSGEVRRRFEGNQQDYANVDFSADGQYLVSVDQNRRLRLWETRTWKEIRHFKGHLEIVPKVCFSPDGKRLLSGSFDATLRLWDTKTGQEIRRLRGHTEPILSVAFSPDGHRAVSGGKDNMVRLWDVETGEEIYCFRGHTADICGVAFSPDGKLVASCGLDQSVRLWRVPEKPSEEMRRKHSVSHEQAIWPLNDVQEGRIRAPDLSKAKLIYQDDFKDPKSGWQHLMEPGFSRGYENGRYIMRSPQGNSWWFRNSPHQSVFSNFACQVVARATGPRSNGWGLEIISDLQQVKGCGIGFRLNSEGELQIQPGQWDPNKFQGPHVGPIHHPCIKGHDEFNTLLMIVRGRQVETYVNSVAVCNPITLDREITPARFSLTAFAREKGVHVEFERFTIWSAEGLPTPESRNR
jgi:formylglycine-generating enzyme required for sulfatase activity/serine/threonine protein kinase